MSNVKILSKKFVGRWCRAISTEYVYVKCKVNYSLKEISILSISILSRSIEANSKKNELQIKW